MSIVKLKVPPKVSKNRGRSTKKSKTKSKETLENENRPKRRRADSLREAPKPVVKKAKTGSEANIGKKVGNNGPCASTKAIEPEANVDSDSADEYKEVDREGHKKKEYVFPSI
jgi:hypothetical protein